MFNTNPLPPVIGVMFQDCTLQSSPHTERWYNTLLRLLSSPLEMDDYNPSENRYTFTRKIGINHSPLLKNMCISMYHAV
uniref:Uncharacterized protein n=1 Tax=Arion vulgaris TaxID=1028688 RepID=A0A0B6YS15_9EUPU